MKNFAIFALCCALLLQGCSTFDGMQNTASSTKHIEALTEGEVAVYLGRAERGDAATQAYLGYCYLTGEGLGQNYVEALRWLQRAASQGVAAAQTNLAIMYQNG